MRYGRQRKCRNCRNCFPAAAPKFMKKKILLVVAFVVFSELYYSKTGTREIA